MREKNSKDSRVLIIAVTPGFLYPDKDRPHFSKKSLSFLEKDMGVALAQAGAMPWLFPDIDSSVLKVMMQEVDGLLVQGGSDMNPESYGDAYLNREKWPGDKYRDDFEFRLISLALEYKRPILGICRGMQVLNAYFGGTLFQDLSTQVPESLEHRNAEIYDQNFHAVTFTAGGILHSLYGKNNLDVNYVNSVHHQGIKTLAADLMVEAISPKDQVIEAFCHRNFHHKDGPKVLGVQWHPEFSPTLGEKIIDHRPLFDYFLNLCR